MRVCVLREARITEENRILYGAVSIRHINIYRTPVWSLAHMCCVYKRRKKKSEKRRKQKKQKTTPL